MKKFRVKISTKDKEKYIIHQSIEKAPSRRILLNAVHRSYDQRIYRVSIVEVK